MTACAAKFSRNANFLGTERPHLASSAGDQAEQRAVFAQRQCKIGARTVLGGCARLRIVDQALIGNVDKGGPGEQRLQMRGLANAEPAALLLGPVLRETLHRDRPEGLAVEQKQHAPRRAAVRVRLFQYRVEDRLELTGMICNTSAVAVCCSSDSRSSVNSRVFSIAMTAWSAKVRTNSICRSVNG